VSAAPSRSAASDAHPASRSVLVVDDSAFMRRVVSELVDECTGFRTMATARDGTDALRLVRTLLPDVVTLDVAMPDIDGLQVLDAIMRECPRPVVVLSGLGEPGLALRALELGAVEFVPKPSGPISLDVVAVRERLHQALQAAAAADVSQLRTTEVRGATSARTREPQAFATRLVCVASSTGGPNALTQILPQLPRGLGAAVVIAQHMPPGFTESLARRLAARCALPVQEAVEGEAVLDGHVYIAPGGRHLRVVRDAAGVPRLALDDGVTRWGVRPSADILFASAATAFAASSVGVVLTGMGRDGADGLRTLRAHGGGALVQSRETTVVPGMPDAALAHAGADAVVPLPAMAGALIDAVARLAAVPA
jgi:two-component system chemotaxis response regulator CheB